MIHHKPILTDTLGWIFALILTAIGVLNFLLVHPVPGMVYVLLSTLYYPPTSNAFRNKIGFPIPPIMKLLMGIAILWFTLGISDLGDMIV